MLFLLEVHTLEEKIVKRFDENEKQKKSSKNSDEFVNFMKKLVSVPKQEIDKEIEREKQAKDKNAKKKRFELFLLTSF